MTSEERRKKNPLVILEKFLAAQLLNIDARKKMSILLERIKDKSNSTLDRDHYNLLKKPNLKVLFLKFNNRNYWFTFLKTMILLVAWHLTDQNKFFLSRNYPIMLISDSLSNLKSPKQIPHQITIFYNSKHWLCNAQKLV